MEDLLFVDYVGTLGTPNCNNRVYNKDLIEREIKKVAAIFAKQVTINPWAENGVTTLSAILTAKQP